MRVILAAGLLALPVPGTTAIAAHSASGAAAFYVAPDGNDAWSGTLAERDAAGTDGPFQSLARARDAVREIKSKRTAANGITVLIRAGTYCLAEPLVLGPDDSGTASCPIIYAAYPGETPVISGGRSIGPWRREGKLFVAEIPDTAPDGWRFRQLFVGDERQTPGPYAQL